MSGKSSNDNDVYAAAREPDAHGYAAMLLVESLIHGLIEQKLISVADAVEIVDTALEVQADVRAELDPLGSLRKSVSLLQAISSSLQRDIPRT